MISPTSSGHFGSPFHEHMRPSGISFALGMSPKCLGHPLVSPQGCDDGRELFCGGAGSAGLVGADRPSSSWPASQGHAGDLPGDITFLSGLQIG
jgi:hypothetical protein